MIRKVSHTRPSYRKLQNKTFIAGKKQKKMVFQNNKSPNDLILNKRSIIANEIMPKRSISKRLPSNNEVNDLNVNRGNTDDVSLLIVTVKYL